MQTEYQTWFRVSRYGNKIQKLSRVIRATPKTVIYIHTYYGGTREVTAYKETSHDRLFSDFMEARNYAVAPEQVKINIAKTEIEHSEAEITRLSLMTSDTTPEELY